jgi:GNAT superfamily N-acetyltransferase
MNRDEFEVRIYDNWARHFGCRLADMHRRGTILLPSRRYAGSRGIHIWYIGGGSFVQMGPEYAEEVAQILGSLAQCIALSGDDLQAAWSRDVISERSVGLVYYLYPDDLHPPTLPGPFAVRQLKPDDAAHLNALFEASSAEEVSEAYVAVDHDVAFGCFAGERLAAAGSGCQRAGFMDLSVLTHPDYRGLGLGRATVAALCGWCWARDVIPQYRCDEGDKYSCGLAEKLGFHPFFRQESLWLMRSALISTGAMADLV